MTGEELGRLLGDAISELQSASMEIEGTVDMLLDIDGKVIVQAGTDNAYAADQPHMTIDELGELIGNALGELESVVMEIESARDLLQSIDGSAISESEADDATEMGD